MRRATAAVRRIGRMMEMRKPIVIPIPLRTQIPVMILARRARVARIHGRVRACVVIQSGCLVKGHGIVQADGNQKGEKENVPEYKPLIQRQHERPLRALPQSLFEHYFALFAP